MLQRLSGVSGHSDVGMKRAPLQASTTRFLRVPHGGRRAPAAYRMTGARTAGDKLLDGGRGIAGQEWHLLGHGIGRARLLGRPTSPAQEAKPIVVGLLQDLGDLFVRGRGQGVKYRCLCRRGPSEHAVEHTRVEMNVKIHGTSEALNDGDGAALAVAYSLVRSAITQPAEHDANEHGQHRSTQFGARGPRARPRRSRGDAEAGRPAILTRAGRRGARSPRRRAPRRCRSRRSPPSGARTRGGRSRASCGRSARRGTPSCRSG